jgi:hypothetical protein
MPGLGYLLGVLTVVALAVWTYGQSYQTQAALREARELRREIRQLRDAIEVHRAEWAFLNSPDRLRQLIEINFDRLGLIPMTADHFGRIDEIAYPMPAPPANRPPPDPQLAEVHR